MADTVPYQAYKSKRHSHTQSGSTTSTTHLVSTASSIISRPDSQNTQPGKEPTATAPTRSFSPASAPHTLEAVSVSQNSKTFLVSAHQVPNLNDSVGAGSGECLGPPSSTLGPPVHYNKTKHVPRKPSTFRRIPRHNSRPPLSSSPRNASKDNIPDHDSYAPALSSSYINRDSGPQRQSNSPSISISSSPASTTVQPLPSIAISELTIKHDQTPASQPISPTRSQSTSEVSTATAHPTANSLMPPGLPRISTPYRPGFQPKGVYRLLTDEFIVLRREKRDDKGEERVSSNMNKVERTKLMRRLEKLIVLHFPVPNQSRSIEMPDGEWGERDLGIGAGGWWGHSGANNRTRSGFWGFSTGGTSMGVSDGGGLWKVLGIREINEVRAAEQKITPWQDDTDASKCPLCATSFHPLTTRKHHCRLCGQIICSLPPKLPQRPTVCSFLFIVDPESRRIEEVGEGVDYGVRRAGASRDKMIGSRSGDGGDAEEEKFLKGVRICRTCRPVVLRQQYLREVTHAPPLTKLYGTFISLEQEIEGALPQFHELVTSLSNDKQPNKDALRSRKRLLEAFAQYDGLAKQIRKLPCLTGSSHDRVQIAVMTRASLFLQKNMFPLQSLPMPKKSTPAELPVGNMDNQQHIDPDSKMALVLQPLLEQEALLESFVEEAKTRRKFEDVKTLKSNLVEIRTEIEKIVTNTHNGMQG